MHQNIGSVSIHKLPHLSSCNPQDLFDSIVKNSREQTHSCTSPEAILRTSNLDL